MGLPINDREQARHLSIRATPRGLEHEGQNSGGDGTEKHHASGHPNQGVASHLASLRFSLVPRRSRAYLLGIRASAACLTGLS